MTNEGRYRGVFSSEWTQSGLLHAIASSTFCRVFLISFRSLVLFERLRYIRHNELYCTEIRLEIKVTFKD